MRPQNNQGRGGSRRRSRRPQRDELPAKKSPPRKRTLWEKIVAFFKGDASARPASRSTSARREPSKKSSASRPENIAVTSPKLYVGNLSFDATESDLFELFNGVGAVKNAEVVSHKFTEKSKGFAFVTMSTIDEAKRAVEELHDKEYLGRKLVVSGAKTSDLRSSEGRNI